MFREKAFGMHTAGLLQSVHELFDFVRDAIGRFAAFVSDKMCLHCLQSSRVSYSSLSHVRPGTCSQITFSSNRNAIEECNRESLESDTLLLAKRSRLDFSIAF